MYSFALKGLLTLFISLSMGYALCILAKKQDGILKTLGYTLGISIIALSLIVSLVSSEAGHGAMGKMCQMKCGKSPCQMMKMQHKM